VNAVQRVFALEQFGIKLGLQNIRALCSALGDPQRAYATVIVGGTNGKGSVTAIVDHALRAAGHRCARYTSPHLVNVTERFAIDGREVSAEALERTAGRVLRVVDALLADGTFQAPPTFFEVTTAIAFEVFREAGSNVAVLEVGLGGRLDATNVADAIAAAITSIDRDHQQQLGDSLEQIAFEKAGIIKPGQPVVLGRMDAEPRTVIARVAAERGAPIVDATGAGGCQVRRASAAAIELTTPVRRYPPFVPGLAGEHQVENALVAVRLLETLEGLGMPVGADAILKGLTDVRWPGRLEWLPFEGGRLLLDSAHNPAGARSLATYLASLDAPLERRPLPLVFGVARDKDIRGMLDALAPVVSRIVATQAATPRAVAADELASRVREVSPSTPVTPIVDAIDACRMALHDSGSAVVAGSIFLVGDVCRRLAK
jgi:dihydrofolate synthase/folylpolyglutamate synthase